MEMHARLAALSEENVLNVLAEGTLEASKIEGLERNDGSMQRVGV